MALQDGKHYWFISREEFEEAISQNQFLEFAYVHNNIYGTSFKAVQDVAATGRCCILDIDVQVPCQRFHYCGGISKTVPSPLCNQTSHEWGGSSRTHAKAYPLSIDGVQNQMVDKRTIQANLGAGTSVQSKGRFNTAAPKNMTTRRPLIPISDSPPREVAASLSQILPSP